MKPFFSRLFTFFLFFSRQLLVLSQPKFLCSLPTFPKSSTRISGRRTRRVAAPMSFPEDVVANILSRLPVTSLVRFRSVSKAWKALIKDPHFISQHLNEKENQKSGCLLVKHRCKITRKHVISLLSPGTYEHKLSNLEVPSVMDPKHLKFVGSYNGLLCLAYDNCANLGSPIILWNPATREFRVLPDCLVSTAHVHNVQVCGIAHGFGYHPLIDDYKLVRIVFYTCFGTACSRTEVYSLKMDCWQEINTFYFRIYDYSCITLSGALYWIAYGNGDRDMIVSFDMCNDVFWELQLPNSNSLGNQMCTKLAVLKGSLHLIVYTFRGRAKLLHVWLMNEHDGEVLWTKQLTIGPLLGVERPLGCGLHGEICLESRKGELVFYNPSTQETRTIPTHGLLYTLEVHYYVDSLVSTGG